MSRSVSAVVSFIEGPDVEGSRDWPLDTIVDVLRECDDAAVGLGVAPTALLRRALADGRLEWDGDGLDGGVTTSFEQWLSVRRAMRCRQLWEVLLRMWAALVSVLSNDRQRCCMVLVMAGRR